MAGLAYLRAMECFEAVGRRGSMQAAAAELGVSPGAVSQQVRRLESHLCVTLLERRGRGLVLTRWGRLYHAELAAGFARLSGADDALTRARDSETLTISGLPTVTAKWLGRSLYAWGDENTDWPLRLISSEDTPDFDRDGVDFAMLLGPPAAGHAGAELFTDQVVPACAPHLLQGMPLQDPSDLLRLPRLQIRWSARYDRFDPPSWERWAAHHGVGGTPASSAVLSFALTATAIDAAVAGQGVVLGQVAMMARELESGQLVVPFELCLPLSAPYSLCWSRAALEKPGGAALRDWLLARGRQQAMALRKRPG
ncbi:MAG: LysR family transcriptional regulator [Confluentimicrobium sp.]|jgi:LysR family glycine cleavage system transcriptional activator|uniref:LysR substrate-binding domain-containing protein n=1 Tax=Actibacterium sp. TaxID=1872125 RepID=UPI0005100A6F|nr:LysR substrate-binding domain-containing protein [Actibacterium sp.]KGB82692.1 hypothetical protein JT55_06280 [Rhodovulum sp. NI22]MBC56574.1 LysR family transcriptional regulator [Actibacterium sp.]MDY6859614.1 LysR substrate-binding domain-containing protein [Pseudomonadota bacterium]|tara:strand:- start:1687 stop:2619 length:933 start_codon:yes stop_codon:yes gene_type:complete